MRIKNVHDKNNVLLRQLVKYGVTGCLAFLVDFTFFSILLNVIHYQIANICGLMAGLLLNFVLSKRWVFDSVKWSRREVLEFAGFTAMGFLISGIGLHWGIESFGMQEEITKLLVACIVFAFNFFVRKYIIFKAG